MKKNAFYWGIACMLLGVIPALLMIYPGHNWGGDFSQYIAQARAVAKGSIAEWYEKNLFIIEHSVEGLGSTVYPWGFPLLLAPLYLLFGENLFVFKLLVIACFGGSILAAFLFFDKYLPRIPAVILTLFIALNPVYLEKTDSINSDIPCMLFSILAIYFVELYLKDSRHIAKNGILAGFFIFCAVQTRTMAFALIAALICVDLLVVICSFWQDRIRASLLFFQSYGKRKWYHRLIPYGVFTICTFIINFFLPQAGGSYLSYFSFTLENVKEMMKRYYECFHEFFGPFFLIFLVFGLIGMIRCFKSQIYLVIYVVGGLFLLLVYEYYQGPRFLFSVFPFLFLFAYYGVQSIYEWLAGKWVYYIAGVFAAVVLILYIIQNGKENLSVRRSISAPIDAYSTDAEGVYAYINENIDDDSIICFFKPRVLYLNTNVYSYTKEDDAAALKEADYVLLWCNDFWDSIRASIEKDGTYELIYQNNQFFLYKCP